MSRAGVVLQQAPLWRPVVAGPWVWTAADIATVTGCPVVAVERNWPLLHRALAERGLTDRRILAGVIGTVAIETASTFEPVREAFWLGEAWRAANLRYYPYYGRGYIQTTWESNYRRAELVLGIPCVAEPDLLLDPWHAARALALYVDERGVAEAALAEAWPSVRYRVLGGYDGTTRLEHIATTLLADR